MPSRVNHAAFLTLSLLAISAGFPNASSATSSASRISVSAQGILVSDLGPLRSVSADGWGLRIAPRAGVTSQLAADLALDEPGGGSRNLPGVPGSVFLLARSGRIIALDPPESHRVPALVQVLDPDGRIAWNGDVLAPVNPTVSPDGGTFACGSADGIMLLDLAALRRSLLPPADLFAPGPNGALACRSSSDPSSVMVHEADGTSHLYTLPGEVRRLAFAPEGSSLYAIVRDEDPGRLVVVDPSENEVRVLYSAPVGSRLRDLRVEADQILLGLRGIEGGVTRGRLVRLGPTGRFLAEEFGPERRVEARNDTILPARLPWPLAPNAQHPVGNTYAEYQNYGGAPYPHPGVDVMGSAQQPVYAVRDGVVKAILTTSGVWHWRAAIGDANIPDVQPGYLYAHLDQPTITVDVGDPIVAGQHLGDLVEWPIHDFHHCHFTRIQDSGTVWDGNWLSIHNPHLDFANQSETEAPIFEPANGTDLLAFCYNETSVYQSPDDLNGQVDIICHVSDRIASDWECTVQELRYTIYPLGLPGVPVVNDKLAASFDLTCDTYGSGQLDALLIAILYKQDSTCGTRGNYEQREFYHILTNSDGDREYEPSDLDESWDTSALPDYQYVIRVTARDVRGNTRADSMVVQTVNGNPAAVADVLAPRAPALWCRPNPARGQARIGFRLATPDDVRLAVFDPAGRRVAELCRGRLDAGDHEFGWDGQDLGGGPAAPGVFFWRLETHNGVETARLVLAP